MNDLGGILIRRRSAEKPPIDTMSGWNLGDSSGLDEKITLFMVLSSWVDLLVEDLLIVFPFSFSDTPSTKEGDRPEGIINGLPLKVWI